MRQRVSTVFVIVYTQEECGESSHKEENRLSMNESSRLSGSGIPKPTAAVKGMTKPTNSVAPMPIVKPDIDGKLMMSVENGFEKKEKIDSFRRNVSVLIFYSNRSGVSLN